MSFAKLQVNLTRLVGPDQIKGGFLNEEAFITETRRMEEEYSDTPNIVSVAKVIPLSIKRGKLPATHNTLVGGDDAAREKTVTHAFTPSVQSYSSSRVVDMTKSDKSRKMPVLGDLIVTVPQYMITSSSIDDGSSRIAASAAAHGIYYTSVPENNPVELITGVPDEFPKPFVPFMILEYHVDYRLIDGTKMKEYDAWMKNSIKRLAGPFVATVRKHEEDQDKQPKKQFEPHRSGWFAQYFAHTRLYFNSKYPTKLKSLFGCPIFRDNSLCADYIKLADVMDFNKEAIQDGLEFNLPAFGKH